MARFTFSRLCSGVDLCNGVARSHAGVSAYPSVLRYAFEVFLSLDPISQNPLRGLV